MARGMYAVSAADLANGRDAEQWDRFVDGCADAVNYHRSRWLLLVARVFGHAVYPLWVRDGEGGVRGVLPLVHVRSMIFGSSLNSLPFFNYGGLLAQDAQARGALLDKASELLESTRAGFVELRNMGWRMEDLPASTHKVTMRLELPEAADALWNGFSAKVRNQIRKAEKVGLDFRSGGPELVDAFYEVFARNMRDLGTPVYSRKLFAAVLDMFADESRVFTVWHGNACIAGGVGVWHRGVFEIPWASSLREFNSLCPNNLLYWGMLRHACELGCTVFDFGRSTPDKGTYRFKKQWGAEPVQLYWHYLLAEGASLPGVNPDNPKYDLPIRIWKRLPVSVATFMGPHIVRCIP